MPLDRSRLEVRSLDPVDVIAASQAVAKEAGEAVAALMGAALSATPAQRAQACRERPGTCMTGGRPRPARIDTICFCYPDAGRPRPDFSNAEPSSGSASGSGRALASSSSVISGDPTASQSARVYPRFTACAGSNFAVMGVPFPAAAGLHPHRRDGLASDPADGIHCSRASRPRASRRMALTRAETPRPFRRSFSSTSGSSISCTRFFFASGGSGGLPSTHFYQTTEWQRFRYKF